MKSPNSSPSVLPKKSPLSRSLVFSAVFSLVALGSALAQTQIVDPPNTPINRTGFKLTFSDEFTSALDLADGSGDSWQGGRKWYSNLPFPATVGDSTFAAENCSTLNGYLLLKAVKNGTTWTSALLSSLFPSGAGFSQKYGYFEARIQMPEGRGTWPQFWLFGPGLNYDKDIGERRVTAEVDVMEDYGIDRALVHQTYHEHTPRPDGSWYDLATPPETTFRLGFNPGGFHTYGVLVKPDFITWYVDEKAVRKMPTPEAAKEPLSVLIDYAIGGGWGSSGVKTPSYTYVDYVRVYQVPLP